MQITKTWVKNTLAICYAKDINPLGFLRKLMPGRWRFVEKGCVAYRKTEGGEEIYFDF